MRQHFKMESKDVQGEEVDVRKDGEQDSRDNAENSSEVWSTK